MSTPTLRMRPARSLRLMSNYLGRYYNLTGGWTEQRALWWPMLAEILTTGADVQIAADNFVSQANANIG